VSAPPVLGLRHGAVRLVPWSPEWRRLFALERARLASALGPLALGIEHVGSTAVPGLVAKPSLDIAVGVAALRADAPWRGPLEALGYDYAARAGVEGSHVFGLGRERTHLVHVVALGGPIWRDLVLLRDALRGDPALCRDYAALKERLAGQHPEDRAAYTAAKGEFIRRALDAHVPRP
jgi:GrpB-like predicted nucleotidyltransferase (UPF0157 family)